MQIHLETGGSDEYVIQAYDTESVCINRVSYHTSLIVSPRRLIENWGPDTVTGLTRQHLQPLVQLQPELILIGSGVSLVFPPVELLRPLIEAGLGYEIMDTGAACRTYNVLMAEGRHVAAGLIIRSGA